MTIKKALEQLLDSLELNSHDVRGWRKMKEPYWIGSKTMPKDEAIQNAIRAVKKTKPKLKSWIYGKVKIRDYTRGESIAIGLTTDLGEWFEAKNNKPRSSRYREGEIDDMIQVKINGKWYYTQNIDWE